MDDMLTRYPHELRASESFPISVNLDRIRIQTELGLIDEATEAMTKHYEIFLTTGSINQRRGATKVVRRLVKRGAPAEPFESILRDVVAQSLERSEASELVTASIELAAFLRTQDRYDDACTALSDALAAVPPGTPDAALATLNSDLETTCSPPTD
ncbi:MAG: hypothetical protein MPN21_14500 [Thermoanaerobaculia bacterium]|nr:hypothetical protein [Thermoanaerobaculia bacterium]